MEMYSSAWHLVSIVLMFLLGMIVAVYLGDRLLIARRLALALYLWHTFFSCFYAWYVNFDGGDSIMYYRVSLGNTTEFDAGTAGIIYLTSFFSTYLNLSFLGTFLAYNIFGVIGLLTFYASLQMVTRQKGQSLRRLAMLMVFLPSVSYWSSAIGKDALSFMSVGISIWAALDFKRRLWMVVVAILVMLLVRPHMAGMMLIALSCALTISHGASMWQRLFYGCMTLVATVAIVPFALDYAGVGGGSDVDALMKYVEIQQGHNQSGGGSVDIATMSPPMQLFTYMFRPLPIEASSIFQLVTSIENVTLLCLFILGGVAVIKRRESPVNDQRVFLWIYALLAWIILAVTTANLGISVRQKWMFAPVLIYLFMSVMGTMRQSAYVSRVAVPQGPTQHRRNGTLPREGK